MPVEIRKVSTKRDLWKFAELPNKLYKGNPYYVPTLVLDDFKTFYKKTNAVYEYCDADFFLAYKDGKIVGRIAAILNPKANEQWNEKHARFGWIDFIDDEEVSSALLSTAEDWARERGMERIEGPFGFTDFDTEGMLVEGFQELGTLVTFYHPEYCKAHLEKRGYTKVIDWVERRINVPEALPEKFIRYKDLVSERYKLRSVRFTRKEIDRLDVGHRLFSLVNETYCVLYGYSPLPPKVMDQYVKLYLGLLNLKYVTFVLDDHDELVAFGVMLPSLSRALQKSNGRYLPFGWWPLIRALKFGKTDTIDMLLIAVKPELQKAGVPAMLFADLFEDVIDGGFKYAETNPELEDNFSMQNLWNAFDCRQHRRRRIYGKELL